MTRADLKAMAKEQIKGNIGTLFLINLIIVAISFVCSYIPYVGSIASTFVISPAFSIALMMIYLDLAKGVKATVSAAFEGFKHFWISFKTTFLVGLFTALWSMLLVIPGIIKSISYSQAAYIIAEDPEIGALEAINRSKAMMNGHKMDYFVLGLSFIGWNLLACLTFGILYIWLLPYMQATLTNFYNSIKPVAEAPVAEEVPAVEAAPVEEAPAEEAPTAE